MGFGIYIHIPYCIQRCHYCDFTTFEQNSILPPKEYIESLRNEIRNRKNFFTHKNLTSIYFGGGTPSLIDPQLLKLVINDIKSSFKLDDSCEITIEINPGTLVEKNFSTYLDIGINRFSVGAQTFNDRLLEACGREHTAADTRKTLKLIQSNNVNYSFDLLFALPHQTNADLDEDLKEILDWSPPHLSAYCLTLPSGHSMNTGRPKEEMQVEMFTQVTDAIKTVGLNKYEISNFAKTGFEAKHNMLYWNWGEYWGLGISAHSFIHANSKDIRFWNTKSLKEYASDASKIFTSQAFEGNLDSKNFENLKPHEALTDFCHTQLRLVRGLNPTETLSIFGAPQMQATVKKLESLPNPGLLDKKGDFYTLSAAGEVLSNQVFEHFTFLEKDLY